MWFIDLSYSENVLAKTLCFQFNLQPAPHQKKNLLIFFNHNAHVSLYVNVQTSFTSTSPQQSFLNPTSLSPLTCPGTTALPGEGERQTRVTLLTTSNETWEVGRRFIHSYTKPSHWSRSESALWAVNGTQSQGEGVVQTHLLAAVTQPLFHDSFTVFMFADKAFSHLYRNYCPSIVLKLLSSPHTPGP